MEADKRIKNLRAEFNHLSAEHGRINAICRNCERNDCPVCPFDHQRARIAVSISMVCKALAKAERSARMQRFVAAQNTPERMMFHARLIQRNAPLADPVTNADIAWFAHQFNAENRV